jgi:hypothetical protein
MEVQQSVGQMSNEEVLALFGTAPDLASRGFDATTHARVWAFEFVASRARLAHYRTLYQAFVEGGMRYMIENLDERDGADRVPAKLVFTDEPADIAGLDQDPRIIVWTESTLLQQLANERAIVDYFAGVLDELQVRVRPA